MRLPCNLYVRGFTEIFEFGHGILQIMGISAEMGEMQKLSR